MSQGKTTQAADRRRDAALLDLTDDRWRQRLLRAWPINLERDIRGAVALSGTRTDSSLAAGVAATINHGLKGGKLRLRDRRGE